MTIHGDTPTIDDADDWRQVEQRHYDPDSDEELTTAIVFAIAGARGVDPTEVKSPTLYDRVDVPAMEQTFFGPARNGHARDGDASRGIGAVEFRYDEVLVKVRSDGWIQVYESTDDDRPSGRA